VSYVLYPPDLVVFFSAPLWLERIEAQLAALESDRPRSNGIGPQPAHQHTGAPSRPRELGGPTAEDLDQRVPLLSNDDQLEMLRALADPTRLRILDMLVEEERYAREIVEALDIAQSAVSRHLSQLERAGLVSVRPSGGMKYYSLHPDAIQRLSHSLVRRFSAARPIR
jgi:DNA-binding transcriptional ArsR family regulator